jgi:hypothetical protein
MATTDFLQACSALKARLVAAIDPEQLSPSPVEGAQAFLEGIFCMAFLIAADLVKIYGRSVVSLGEILRTNQTAGLRLENIRRLAVACTMGRTIDGIETSAWQPNMFPDLGWFVSDPTILHADKGLVGAITDFFDWHRFWPSESRIPEDGHAWDILTPACLSQVHELRLDAVGPSTEKKKKGIVYTPPELAAAICKSTIDCHAIRHGVNRDTAVLDPASGTGTFLVVAANALLGSASKNESFAERCAILANQVYGVDGMPSAVKIAKWRLWFWSIEGFTVPGEAVELPDLEGTIKPGNSLVGPVRPTEGNERVPDELVTDVFDWQAEFPRIMARGGFDIVTGNPPYVFTRGKLFDVKTLSYLQATYVMRADGRTVGKARQQGKVNASTLFLLRGIELLRNGGTLGFILPNTFLRATTSDYARQLVASTTCIERIVDLNDGTFKGVTTAPVVLILSKNAPLPDHEVQVLQGGFDASTRVKLVSQSGFLANTDCAFNIHSDPELDRVFDLMKQDSFPLGSICRAIIEGLVTRKDDAMFTSDGDYPLAKKLLRGRDVDRFEINWKEGQYIVYDENRLHRPRPRWVHEAPKKLVLQRIGGGSRPLRVTLDERQHYIFASTNAIILNDEPVIDGTTYTYEYILAYLNSAIINAYYKINFTNRSKVTVNISRTYLQSIPVKKATPSVQGTIGGLARLLGHLHEDPERNASLIKFYDESILDAIMFELCTSPGPRLPLLESIQPVVGAFQQALDSHRNEIEIAENGYRDLQANLHAMEILQDIIVSSPFISIRRLFSQ